MKHIDFDIASFIIDCFIYVLFNTNPYFLEQKFDDKTDREYVETFWNYLIPSKFYIYICRNDNLIVLNKLSLKYQNTLELLNNFILEDNDSFLMLKEHFKKNDLLYQYIYFTLFPEYFCRVDDHGVKSKLAFEVAHTGYRNQQESLLFVHLQRSLVEVKQEQNETDLVEVIESTPPTLPLKSKTVQKSKKRKVNANNVAEKILLKKKRGKKGKLLSELEANNLQMKHINCNVNK